MVGRVFIRSRSLPWLLAILGVLALVAAHGVWDYVEARLLKAAVDRIPPQALAAPGPPNVDPAYDAAPYFQAASDLVQRDIPVIGEVESDLHRALLRGTVPDDLRRRARALIAGSDALRLFDRATTLEFRGFPQGTTGHPAEMRTLARLAGIRAIVSAIDGLPDLAASSIAAEISVEGDPRGLAREVFFSRFMTTVANLQIVLTASTPDEPSLARIATALALADQDDAFGRWLERRRALVLSYVPGGVDYAESGRVGLFGHNELTLVQRIARPWAADRLRFLLERLQAQIDAARRPWPGRLDAVARQLAIGTSVDPWRRQLSFLAADLAVVRAGRVAVAIERFRRAHSGRVPSDLSQLPWSLLEAVPIDPFSGTPIRFRTLASGYVVYSVGPDGRDDGGATTGFEAFGHAWPYASADIGARIAR